MEEKDKKEEKEMEQWNDVKDKKGSGLVIVLLLLIIAGLGCFIFLNKDKLFGEKETKESEQTEKEEVEETVTFTDSELQKYVDNIRPVSIGPSAKLFNVDKVVVSELSAAEKIEYVGLLVNAYSKETDDYAKSYILEKDVKNVVEEIYGPNTYAREDFSLGCGKYSYQENTDRYFANTGCGGATSLVGANKVIDYKATKNKLEITTAYVFANPDGIYKDFELKEVLGNSESTDNMEEYLANYIKEHKDELNHIVYTFESSDGRNYYFTGFTNNR